MRGWVAVGVLSVVVGAVAAGCGDDGVAAVDAGSADAGADAGTGPAPAALPVLTPCPTGWREVRDRELVTCDPWPASGRATCPDGEAHFPGEPACAPVGATCPTGDFPDGLPADREVFYVLASAPAGGDGSEAMPFNRIRDAISRAALVGGIVAVGKGRYDEAFSLRGGIIVWGACAAETVIVSSAASPGTAVVSATLAGASELRNLAIGRSERRGVMATGAGVEVTLQGAVVEGSVEAALLTGTGAHIVGRDVVVRDVRPMAGPPIGYAAGARSGSSIELHRAVLERLADEAVTAREVGSSILLEDVAVLDDDVLGAGRAGSRGIGVQTGAVVTARRVVLERMRDVGVATFGAGSDVTLEDVVIRDTRPDPVAPWSGSAIQVIDGSTATLRRVLLDRASYVHLNVSRGAAVATVEDLVIRGSGEVGGAPGLSVQWMAQLDASRVYMTGVADLALLMGGGDVVTTLRDLTIVDVVADSEGLYGRAIQAQAGVSVTLERVHVARAQNVGVLASGADVSIVATDLVVEATALSDCETTTCPGASGGHGIASVDGASVRLARFRVQGSAACGALVADDAALDLSEGDVVGNAIGGCVQVDGYDLARLSDRVRYADNGRALESTMLPVPMVEPLPP